MKQGAMEAVEARGIGDALRAMIGSDGSRTHRYVHGEELNRGPFAARNLADAAHYLCLLQGRQPGVIDFAADRTAEPGARQWLNAAVNGFGRERVFLAQLTVAAGPQPSTTGHTASESAVLAQRHAIETLAQSERKGCALGAAVALVIDWREIRTVLNAAAAKLSVDTPGCQLPDSEESYAMIDRLDGSPALRRAIAFGAEQVLVQHRGLWDLLEAREAAREDW